MKIESTLPDTQNSVDTRQLVIDRVGIKDIAHPFEFIDSNRKQHTIGKFTMTVRLPEHIKGTHMSRFIEILNSEPLSLSLNTFDDLLQEVKTKLDSKHAYINASFPFFRQKTAPVSAAQSLLDYQVNIEGELDEEGSSAITCSVVVPVTSLCPCSKKISNYGAHNQRSHITLSVRVNDDLSVSELIDIAEAKASSQLYAVLKREDEKFVTEQAYNNPAFVEDLVRDIATALNENKRISHYCIESENFESIHNHSAYAMIEYVEKNL